MAFRALRELGNGAQDLKTILVGNSEAVALGDAIIGLGTGHAGAIEGAKDGTSGHILGVVVGILQYAATQGIMVTELDSVTAGATNETTKQYYVSYIPSYIPMEYEAKMSAAIGTTTDSDGSTVSFAVLSTNSGQLDETSVALFTATVKQFVSNGQAPYTSDNTLITGHWSAGLGQF